MSLSKVIPEDDLSMEILQRAEKIAREMHPDAVRDLATAKQASSLVILFSAYTLLRAHLLYNRLNYHYI